MKKSILMSIRPEWVAKILNGEKTIEIRKGFPKDYRGWVYIYCTKGKIKLMKSYNNVYNTNYGGTVLNGKVVARFYCDNVDEIKGYYDELYMGYGFENEKELLEKSCLWEEELGNYLKIYNNNDYDKVGYAIHISQLEIFGEPKELNEFYKLEWYNGIGTQGYRKKYLKRPPQSYMFIETGE